MLKLRIGSRVVIGLSDLNLVRLRDGRAITFKLSELGLIRPEAPHSDADVYIVWGETEEAICRDLGVDSKTGEPL